MQEQSAISREESAAMGVGTILMVEDRVDLRELVGHSLQAFGYRALVAESVDDAVTLAGRARKSHRRVGYRRGRAQDERRRTRRAGAETTTVDPRTIHVGYAPDPEHRTLFANNGAAFPQKPVTPEQLTIKVAALLRGSR